MARIHKTEIPLFLNPIAAGFPNPVNGDIEGTLDLNTYLIKHPAATYFVRARGESMIDAGIHEDDILIVDKALEPRNGSIVVAAVSGEFTVKIFNKKGNDIILSPANPKFEDIYVKDIDFEVWGVVTFVVHTVTSSL